MQYIFWNAQFLQYFFWNAQFFRFLIAKQRSGFFFFLQNANSVKRVWALHSALELVDMTNESSSLFFDLLQQTVVNNNYLGTDEVCTLLS